MDEICAVICQALNYRSRSPQWPVTMSESSVTIPESRFHAPKMIPVTITGITGHAPPEYPVFKVWPTFRDQKNFILALEAQGLEELRSRFPTSFTQVGTLKKVGADHPPALEALWYFTSRFESWIAEVPERTSDRAESLILAILRDMKIVSILLDPEDDAQVIFETLNGRGAQLHATDLIRNYLFMRADRDGADSQNLYDTLWSPFETAYWAEYQRRGRMKKPRLEWLIHASLQAELHEEIDLSRLYFEYRSFPLRVVGLLRQESSC